jgi:glycosyltransferase involved in cell wall biosynthesis
MYNARSTIIECVESIIAQDYDGELEIIVIDDGSTDDCYRLVKTIQAPKSRRIRLLSQKNTGVSGARHFGVMSANHNLISFCDADDCWVPHKISSQINAYHQLISNDPYLLIGCTQGHDIHPVNAEQKDAFLSLRSNLMKWSPHPSTWLFKKELYSSVGCFDLNLTHAEDADFISRLLLKGFKVYLLHSQGLSSNQLSMVLGEIRIAKMVYRNSSEINFLELQLLKLFYISKLVLRFLNLRRFFPG